MWSGGNHYLSPPLATHTLCFCCGITRQLLAGARDQIEVQQEGTVTETDAISLVQLIIAADCWSSQAAGKLFQAKLGVQFSELAKTGEAYKEASDICSRVVLTACTSDGSIVEVCLDKASIGS